MCRSDVRRGLVRREPAERTLRTLERTHQIKRVYAESNGGYGSPRVTLVLRMNGYVVTVPPLEQAC